MTTGGHGGAYPTMSRATCGDAEGLSTYEAAEITGIGQAAFKSRRHQARLRVRAATATRPWSPPTGEQARGPSAPSPERYTSGQALREASAHVDAETRKRPRGSGVTEIRSKARLTDLTASGACRDRGQPAVIGRACRLGPQGQRVNHCRERTQITWFCAGGAERRMAFTAMAGSTDGVGACRVPPTA